MSCGDAFTIKASHSFVVTTVYISPETLWTDIMNLLLHNFRAMCLPDLLVIIIGDFNVNVLQRENQRLVTFLDSQLGLHLLSGVTQ